MFSGNADRFAAEAAAAAAKAAAAAAYQRTLRVANVRRQMSAAGCLLRCASRLAHIPLPLSLPAWLPA